MKKNLLILITFLCLLISNVSASKQIFSLKVGDLLFQDLNCGILCDGIGEVTYGVNNTYMSHVGMVESVKGKEPIIIEAIGPGVIETPLHVFLNRSHDKDNKPMVMVGRLTPSYQHLIPGAIKFAKSQLGKPYNSTFIPNKGESYYCSQLIYDAFSHANQNKSIFGLNIMDFTDPKTHQTTPEWKSYFADLKIEAPQGQIGTNPGMMSRESDVQIVYSYGKLRIHSLE